MADDREIPGSGDVRSRREREDAPPPSPQGTTYESQGPPEPEGSARSWWPFCLIAGIVGCGCLLLVLLALGVIGGVSWSLLGGGEGETPATNTPANTSIEEPAEGSEPGADAALAWAMNRRPDWSARINDHSGDWQWVRLTMAPPGREDNTWVEISWNPSIGGYDLLDEGPIAQEDSLQESVPDVYQPGEEVAKEAALGHVEQPDWVARVDSHSDDWRRATVSVGPPASEYVYVVTLEWDDEIDAYDLISIDDIDYPGTG